MVSQKLLDGFDDLHELPKIHGLGDVAVAVELVDLQDVLLGAGSGQHHDGDRPQLLIRLDFREHFAAVFARQIQIQQDHVRPRRGGVRPLAAQELHRLDAVIHDGQVIEDLAFLQGLDGQVGVAGAVFHQQDFNRRGDVWVWGVHSIFTNESIGRSSRWLKPRRASGAISRPSCRIAGNRKEKS